MSKQLKITLWIAIFLAVGSSSYYVFAKGIQKDARTEIESPYVWGKSVGAVQVRLEGIKKSNRFYELKASIMSRHPEVEIEWKLPEGAYPTEGNLKSRLKLQSEGVTTTSLNIEVESLSDKVHAVILVKSLDPKDPGAVTAVYALEGPSTDQKKLQKIQQMMKKRSSKPVL